jgi:hypothetical protein
MTTICYNPTLIGNILLLKPQKLLKAQNRHIKKCLNPIDSVIEWTIDWDDPDRIIRIVLSVSPEQISNQIIDCLREKAIYTVIFQD